MREPHALRNVHHPGLADPVLDSQRVFRTVLEAMSHPGRVLDVPVQPEPPAPLDAASAAIALSLLDFETAVWLQPGELMEKVPAYLSFHCGCPVVEHTRQAAFALASDGTRLPPLETFDPGQEEQPYRSTTLIIQVQALIPGQGPTLSGPGIANTHRLDVVGLHTSFWAERAKFRALFPLGVDVLFTAGNQVAALPRTTIVEG